MGSVPSTEGGGAAPRQNFWPGQSGDQKRTLPNEQNYKLEIIKVS